MTDQTQAPAKSFGSWHLIVMALGNIIGSGIFLASGAVIALAGPAAILAYAVGGVIMLLEVMFIAEMSIVNPAPGSFRVHASEVFGPWIGFVNGWMFWCSGLLGMASEVTAAAIFTAYWFPRVPLWVFCLAYSILMTCINFMDVRGLSKVEMWLASVKVLALALFILLGLLSVLGLLPAVGSALPADIARVRPFFPNGVQPVLASMLIVLFSYTGTGIIGLAIADTKQPEKNVPPAIYIIALSVIVLYVLSVFLIVVLKPWNTVSSAQSPFVVIMQQLGIPFGGTVLNIVVLTASLSGLNSAMYSASRMLFSLGKDRQGPALFLKTNKSGVPVYALGASSLVLMLTAALSYLVPERVFILLIGASGFTAMFNWLTISVTHYYYRKKVLREKPEKLKYKAPGYPFVTFLAILLIIGVLASSPLYPGQTASLAAGVILIVGLAVLYRILKSARIL